MLLCYRGLFLLDAIHSFIRIKNFSAALEITLSRYSVENNNHYDLDHIIAILSFWKNYEYKYPMYDFHEIYNIWCDFDTFVIKNSLFAPGDIIKSIAEPIMSDIQRLLFKININPDSQISFLYKILYAKSLIWIQEPKAAFAFLSELIRYYPSEPEVWALFGRLYSQFNQKKSLFFYRESFLINPSVLNLIDINSIILKEVLKFYQSEIQVDINKNTFLHWLAIYGVISRFFSIQHKMTKQEEEILEKRIMAYEQRYYKMDTSSEEETLNLLRLFVFQYDYYRNIKHTDAQKVIQKIQSLSPIIYQKLN